MARTAIILALTMIIRLAGCAKTAEKSSETTSSPTGGVIICGTDYPCGQADSVCPEDYGATCKVADADCKEVN